MHKIRAIRLASVAFWGLTLAAAALFVALRVACIVPFGWLQDEGSYVASALAVSRGLHLFTQVEVLVYPVVPEFLGLVFRVFPPSLELARLACIGLATLYIVTVAVTGRRLSTWLGGLASLAVLSSDAWLFREAGHALADIPSLLFISTSVLLAMVYLTSGKRTYLALASAACAVSFLTKPLIPFLPIWIAVVVLTKNWRTDRGEAPVRWRPFFAEGVLAFVSFCIPLAVCLLVYDAGAFLATAYSARITLQAEEGLNLGYNVGVILTQLRYYWGAMLLAIVGTLLARGRPGPRLRSLGLLWGLLAAMLVSLLAHSPLFSRHCVILSLPLALMAGISVAGLVEWRPDVAAGLVPVLAAGGHKARGYVGDDIRQVGDIRRARVLWGAGIAAGLLAVVFAAQGIGDMNAWAKDGARYGQGGSEASAISLLQKVTAPSEAIASDDVVLALMANRTQPPELSDVSHARILSGGLTAALLRAVVGNDDIQAICLWTTRFDDLPDFVDWANAHFVSEQDFGKGRRILYGRRYDAITDIPGLIPTPDAALGDAIALVGYRLTPAEPQAGAEARLTLYWRCVKPLDGDYQVFVHLADATGKPLAQGDAAPLNGLYPTNRWRAGDILADVHRLPVGASVPAGDYSLRVGMYDPASMNRLPVTGAAADAAQSALTLTTIRLNPAPPR